MYTGVTVSARPDEDDALVPGAMNPPPAPAASGSRTTQRWRPGVRLVLFLVILLPVVSTVVLTVSSAASNWTSRQHAQTVAADARALNQVALARLQFNDARVPVMAVGFAEDIRLSESVESRLLGVDLAKLISQSAGIIEGNPVFRSNAALRAETATFASDVTEVESDTISYPTLEAQSDTFADDIDDLWYSDYNKLEHDADTWHAPGSFDVHVAALRQTYEAFLQGGYELEGTIYVLEGIGGGAPRQEVVEAEGAYKSATEEFSGKLGQRAHAQWNEIQTSPADKDFQYSVGEAVNAAVNGGPALYVSDPLLAGADMRHGLQFLSDDDNLVRAGSSDLVDSANAVASNATRDFIIELVFLIFLVAVSIGGAVIGGRTLTRPLKRLSSSASRIHSGEFDLEPLPESGPREVVTTTSAFNDMASTLKGVEAKTMALATEDLSHPELQMPLPGRTGQALQVAVDKLSAAIREREMQRQQLEHSATHDALTTLYNRAAIFTFLETDVERRRNAGETVGVLFVDLNGLKQLNDAYGHGAGDAAIVSTSEALLEATTPCCVVGRLGGDEFLVVLCHAHSQVSEESATKMRDAVGRRSIALEGQLIPLSATVGLALAECDASTDPMALVRIADDAMYEAKRAARMARDQLVTHIPEQPA